MKERGVLAIMAMAVFIIVIDTTIMNVSISALVEDLNTTVTGIQSAISLYALVMASFMLIGGKLADVWGRRRTFLIGVVVFGIGTSIASVANSLAVLMIGWSVIEGIGSALMMPNIQTIIRSAYKGAERATAYGVVAAVAAVGAALGPIVGGFLTTYASWRWAFRFEVVVVLVVLVMRNRIQKDQAIGGRFDYAGAILSSTGWAAIVLGILLAQEYGIWIAKQPFVIGGAEIAPFGLSIAPVLMGTGVITILGLIRLEKRNESAAQEGLFRPSLFALPGLSTGFGVRFLHMLLMAAFLFTYPLFLQLTFAYTAMETGVALLPYSFGVLVPAVLGGRLGARFQARRVVQVGLAVGVVGLLVLAGSIQPGISVTDVASGLLFGLGMGLVASQIVNLILSTGNAESASEISGLNGTFEQLGNSIGVALVGSLMIGSLSAVVSSSVLHTDLPPEEQTAVVAAAESGIELMSDEQMQSVLDDAGASEATADALAEIYSDARTQAFRTAMLFLAFLGTVALMFTPGLSDQHMAESLDTLSV